MKKNNSRVYLKKLEIKDIDNNVMSWFNDTYLMKYYTNSRKKITKDDIINSIKEGNKNNNNFTYGIFYKDEHKLIGTIKIGPINKAHKTSDLVVLIGDRDFLGKGLSVEAIKIGNDLAFNEHNIRKLYGGMYRSNIPSIKAYIRAGWYVEGILKGQFLVDGVNEDRVLVGNFNPKYFDKKELEEIKKRHLNFVKLLKL